MLKNKLPFIIFTIAIVGLLIWVFFVFKERNILPVNNFVQKTEQQQTQNEDQKQTNSSDQQTSKNSAAASLDSTSNYDEFSSDENIPIEKTNLTEVSSKDCDNNCKNFTDSEKIKYCQEVCGFAPAKKETPKKEGCDALSDLEKDYCLKDFAISKKDLTICEKIEDSGIQKTCRNRITEDILDSQK